MTDPFELAANEFKKDSFDLAADEFTQRKLKRNEVYLSKGESNNLLTNALRSIPFIGKDLVGALEEDNPTATGMRESLVAPINSVDTFLSAQAGSLAAPFSEKWSDEAFRAGNQRVAERSRWANPNQAESGTVGKIVGGTVGIVPNLVSWPFSSASTGKTAIDVGESLPRALAATGIDTVGNMAGAAAGLLGGKSVLGQTIAGGLSNAAQDVLTKLAIQKTLETKEGQKAFEPSAESAFISGLTGGATSGVMARSQGLPFVTEKKPLVEKTQIKNAIVDSKQAIKEAKIKEAEIKLLTEPKPFEPTTPKEEGGWYTGSPEELKTTRTLEEQAVRPNADEQKAGPGHYITMSKDLAGVYGGKGGSLYRVDSPFEKPFDLNFVDPNTRVSNETLYNQMVEQLGSRTEANKALKDQGFDAITFTDPRGNKIANIFNAKNVSLEGPARRADNFVGELELLPMEERTVSPDTVAAPKTPETITAKQQLETKAKILENATDVIPKEWRDVNTLEEAKALAQNEPDISGSVVARGGRAAASGIQGTTIMSGNPFLRYIRKVAGDGRALQARLSQALVTNKTDGLATRMQKLSGNDLIATIEALQQGSRQKFALTEEVMNSLGFNQKQKDFVEAFYKHSEALLEAQNAVRKDLGFKPIEPHEGWFPDSWKGQFKTLVTNAKGHAIGYITTDTKYQQKAAKEWYANNHPGAQFSSMLYQGMQGKNNVDMFSGLSDVLALVAKNDPVLADILAKGQEAREAANNTLFGVDKHAIEKSGRVSGSEGNKPWLSRERNAKDAAKAMIDYFETAIEHAALQKPLAEINKIVTDPEITHTNAKKELQEYANHIKGQTGAVGRAINGLGDALFGDVLGVGSRVPVNAAGHLKNLMNRKFMGLNPGFLLAQLLQPAQTWAPVASVFADKLGMPQHAIIQAFANGSKWALSENLAKWYENPKLSFAPEHIKEAIKYAEDRGLHAFNELELSHRATKRAITRKAGEVADFTISTGDRMTKLPAFLGLVDMLYGHGQIPLKEAMAIAEKGVETGMTNYHPWERPRMYQKLGVLGQFAGGLTTFKHSQLNLFAKTVQEAFGKQRNPKSMLGMTAGMVFFGGITGLIGYAEADQLYGALSDMITGKKHTIREDLLQKLPELLKSGVISVASGLNWQAKVSSADLVPDTLAKAASPHLEAAGKMIGSTATAVADPTRTNMMNAVQAWMPTGFSKAAELLNVDEQGRVLGKDGLPKYEQPTSPEERASVEKARSIGRLLGVGSLYDAVQGNDLYKDREAFKAQQEKLKTLAIQIKMAYREKEFAKSVKLAKDYDKLSGVPGSGLKLLEERAKKEPVEGAMTPRQRAQGLPKDLRGVRQYETFNDGE